jgi:HAMP domain-containing protein
MRLAAIAATTVSLEAQLSELERLREQVRKAQLPA